VLIDSCLIVAGSGSTMRSFCRARTDIPPLDDTT
jgi:hypothetical protein